MLKSRKDQILLRILLMIMVVVVVIFIAVGIGLGITYFPEFIEEKQCSHACSSLGYSASYFETKTKICYCLDLNQKERVIP